MPPQKPYTVMTVVESESGSWNHEIRVSHRTGVTYCTCRGWQFRKTCKHLDAYNAAPRFTPGQAVAAPQIDLASNERPAARQRSTPPTNLNELVMQQLANDLVSRGYVKPLDSDLRAMASRLITTINAHRKHEPQPVQAPSVPLVASANIHLNAAGMRVIVLPD